MRREKYILSDAKTIGKVIGWWPEEEGNLSNTHIAACLLMLLLKNPLHPSHEATP